MGFSYNVNVLNQKGSPALYTDTFANRPAAGYAGRLFIANDTSAIYEDTGTAWVLIANVSSGAGTLQQVTTNGNTTDKGITITALGLSTNSLTDTALTLGSVPFTGAGGLISQDNANFFWDDTNNRLGINTNTPGNSLDVHSSGTNPILALNNTAGNQSAISFLNTSVAKWRIGNTATTNTFDIFNFGLSTNAIKINNGDNSIDIPNIINVQSNGSTFGTSANGATPVFFQANNGFKVMQLKNIAGGTADINLSGTASTSIYGFDTFSTINAFSIENNGDTKTKSISYAEEFILNNATLGILAALTRNLTAPGIGILQLKNSAFAYIQPTTLTVDRTYTLPDATGTIALTSNLSAYLPLAGGTLTGALGGTSASFTSSVQIKQAAQTSTSGLLLENSVNNTQLRMYTDGTNWRISPAYSSGGSLLPLILTSSIGGADTLTASTLGNVLINSTTDDTVNKLQVTGGAKFTDTSQVQTSGGDAVFYAKNGTVITMLIANTTGELVGIGGTESGHPYILRTSNTEKFRISTSGVITIKDLVGTGSRAVIADANGVLSAPVSDQSVKQNIEPLKYGLQTIMQLNAVQFEFKEDYKNYGEGLQIGAIAQEVEQIIPEAVFKTSSTGLKGIDYNQFNGVYIKAIQEQQQIIENLIQRIELLENK